MAASVDDEDAFAFLTDSRLAELSERLKTSVDVLDVITLHETQHSDLMAFCLNPREGHAQGDETLKDLLVAAHSASAVGDPKFSNRKFFAHWTPGRIRCASFGAAMVFREFPVSSQSRLDLLIVDLQNEILLVVENKAGARLTPEQLRRYYGEFRDNVAGKPCFQDFHTAFIVLDERLEDHETDAPRDVTAKWVCLDYSWMESAARRAAIHVERGNASAALVVAYCERQTTSVHKRSQRSAVLAADMAIDHRSVVNRLLELRRLRVTNWTPATLCDTEGALLTFAHQHPAICHALHEARGIAALERLVRQEMPELTPRFIVALRAVMWIRPPVVERVASDVDDDGPIRLQVKASLAEDARYRLRLLWLPDEVAPQYSADALRDRLSEQFPDLQRYAGRRTRSVCIGKDYTARQMVEVITRTLAQINQVMREFAT